MKIKSIWVSYREVSDKYVAKIGIGDEEKLLEFKLNDQQTRELLRPLADTICAACAVNAEDIKRKIVADLEIKTEDTK